MRHIVAIILLAAALLTGCGCGDDRSPSRIDIELSDPLAPGAYSFTVCIDDGCTEFSDLSAIGEDYVGETTRGVEGVGGMDYLNTAGDAIHYGTFNAIAPGEHRLTVVLADTDGTVFSFEGDLEFVQVDRCHSTDSRVSLDADQLTYGT